MNYDQKELQPPAMPLSSGSFGPDVKRLQEWLCLHGFHTAIDGDFGPATEAALKSFQRTMDEDWHEVAAFGVVDGATWGCLVEPLRRATQPLAAGVRMDARQRIVEAANTHCHAQPREVGGPNSGPWVRLYMDGSEGADYPWCAGFATYVLRQALGHDKWRTFSCDDLGFKAARERRLVRINPQPGDLFLIRSPAPDQRDDWIHCGIVTAVGSGYFETIEGNTNTNGAREGTAVHARTRAFGPNVDFVLVGER